MVSRTTSLEEEEIEPIYTGEDVLRFHRMIRKVPVAEDMVRYAVQLAARSRPGREGSLDFAQQYISWGAGLRAAQYLVLGAKARALLEGRAHVVQEDIEALAKPSLRHRILVNYRAEAEGIGVDSLIDRLLQK